jgi:hypothetical protein
MKSPRDESVTRERRKRDEPLDVTKFTLACPHIAIHQRLKFEGMMRTETALPRSKPNRGPNTRDGRVSVER